MKSIQCREMRTRDTCSVRSNGLGQPIRSAMTLIEVLIALALTAVIAGLVGGLMQWYVNNQTKSENTFEQLRLARNILAMIADDIRSTVRNEPFDVQPLVQLIQNSQAGAMMGAMQGASSGGAGGSSAGGGGSGLGNGMTGSGASAGSSLSASSSDLPLDTGTSTLPPGIYGSATALEIDVTRPPRPDQYFVQPVDVMGGTLTDLPTDLKTVSYYVQPASLTGVRDSLSALSNDAAAATTTSGLTNSGLVRRSLARAVIQKVYLDGNPDQINRTGELVAREVVGIAFQYFDGTQWMQTWDSSAQGIPLVIQVMIAIQDPGVPLDQRLPVPIDLSMAAPATLLQSGVKIFSTNVPIPGAALATNPGTGEDDGSAAMGIQL